MAAPFEPNLRGLRRNWGSRWWLLDDHPYGWTWSNYSMGHRFSQWTLCDYSRDRRREVGCRESRCLVLACEEYSEEQMEWLEVVRAERWFQRCIIATQCRFSKEIQQYRCCWVVLYCWGTPLWLPQLPLRLGWHSSQQRSCSTWLELRLLSLHSYREIHPICPKESYRRSSQFQTRYEEP